MRKRAFLSILVVVSLAGQLRAGRPILADDYRDKVRGMWLGQILGNYAGRPTEGVYHASSPGYPRGSPAASISWDFVLGASPPTSWGGDDDTVFEYMYGNLLSGNSSPSNAQIRQTWETLVPTGSFYIANKQARYLMATPSPDLTPPATGSINNNMHWYAIDSQITTESVGAMVPGMRQRAADLAGQFARVTNDGYAVHAAQFYAAMYSAAAVENVANRATMEGLVNKGLAVTPTTSRSYEVVRDVRDWYLADKAANQADAGDPLDWRDTHELLYNKYAAGPASKGRYRYWIESTVNLGLTTMAVLYGAGDYKDTVEVGVLGGFDSDCNPATAGGLVGMITGYSGLPADLTAAATDNYTIGTLAVASPNTTITDIAAMLQTAAEGQILAGGGTITGAGAARTYNLPDADPVNAPPERPDPTGPKGLVAMMLAGGHSVTVSASVEAHNPNNDRNNLDAIIDGVSDLSYNGHLPYNTYDGAGSAGDRDYYQINFDQDLTFARVVFHEGDIRWNGINNDPRASEPQGGYFLNLTVEVGDDGVFTEVANLQMDEELDPYAYFQEIELSFDAIAGDAIRIVGDAGGTHYFTSISELEVHGLDGDANGDGYVSLVDYTIWAANYDPNGDGTAHPGMGDFTGDGLVTLVDYTIWAANYAPPPPSATPEPTSALVLAIGAALTLLKPKRKP